MATSLFFLHRPVGSITPIETTRGAADLPVLERERERERRTCIVVGIAQQMVPFSFHPACGCVCRNGQAIIRKSSERRMPVPPKTGLPVERKFTPLSAIFEVFLGKIEKKKTRRISTRPAPFESARSRRRRRRKKETRWRQSRMRIAYI